MSARYHLDPAKYTLHCLKHDLLNRDLIPSRRLLKEGIEEKFQKLESAGLNSLQDLLTALKTKPKMTALSDALMLEPDYLNLLRREVNSYFPTPVALDKYKGFPADLLEALADLGIKNSRDMYEQISSPGVLQDISQQSGIPLEILRELAGLSDLTRAYGIGPVFARILYDTGIKSISDLKQYSPDQVVDLYEKQTEKKADFTASDIQFSLNITKCLDLG